jgi:hypothetical protein
MIYYFPIGFGEIMAWLLEMIENNAVAILSACVSFSSMVATVWFARKNWSRELMNQRMNLVNTRLKYFEDFKKWADELVGVLTESIHLCDLDPKQVVGEPFFYRRHRLRIALSSMIDSGRWFFPNIEVDDHGEGKELGYRGYRHELLDGLVSAYRCLQKIDYKNPENNKSIRNDLTMAKRHFVGQVQKIINPSAQRSEFDRITSEIDRLGELVKQN